MLVYHFNPTLNNLNNFFQVLVQIFKCSNAQLLHTSITGKTENIEPNPVKAASVQISKPNYCLISWDYDSPSHDKNSSFQVRVMMIH